MNLGSLRVRNGSVMVSGSDDSRILELWGKNDSVWVIFVEVFVGGQEVVWVRVVRVVCRDFYKVLFIWKKIVLELIVFRLWRKMYP